MNQNLNDFLKEQEDKFINKFVNTMLYRDENIFTDNNTFLRKSSLESMKWVLEEVENQNQLVTYKKDGGHGSAVPCGIIFKLLEQITKELEAQ